jgi:hypothetical protein
MCKGMNRSIFNVVLGGFGTEGGTVAAGAGAGDRLVRSGSAEDAAFIMKNASYDEVSKLEEINRDFASTKPGGRKCEEPPPPAIPVSFGAIANGDSDMGLPPYSGGRRARSAAAQPHCPAGPHPGRVDRCAVMRSKQPALVPNASLSNRDWNSPRR